MVLQTPVKVQTLVATLRQDARSLAETMHPENDAVIVSQGFPNGYEEFDVSGAHIRHFSMQERGVGRNRNAALLYADGDVCLFSDEDIVYDAGYAKKVAQAYEAHPDADLILFNIRVNPERKTYWIENETNVKWYNYGRYPAYSISAKLESLRRANVWFSLLYGGGARYGNGEDNLFLHDCLKAGLKILAVPVCLGEEQMRESTWFHGYTEKFFTDRGVLYHDLYGHMAVPFGFRFLWKNKKTMCAEISFSEAFRLLKSGIKIGRTGETE